jgi:hypothetical protein
MGRSLDGRRRTLDNLFIDLVWRSVKDEEVYLNGDQTPESIHTRGSEIVFASQVVEERALFLYILITEDNAPVYPRSDRQLVATGPHLNVGDFWY